LTTTGTITAQTLVVQTITSSIVNITGSNIFGSRLSDTQTFTGSVVITGSLTVNTTGPELQVNNNGVILGNLPTDRHGVTGSFYQTGSIAGFSNCVGIGTNIPTYRLDIQNPADFDIRLRDNSLGGTVGILFETANDFSGTSQAYIKGVGAGNSGLSDLILGTSCAVGATSAIERMRITSGGNVGIGTCSPSQRLEVVGGEIKAGRVDSTNEGGQVSFGRALDNNTSWYIDTYGSAASPQLRFVNVDNAVVAMTITGSNVGIGTSDPKTKLQINDSGAGAYTMLTIHNRQARAAGVGARINLLPNSDFTAGVDTGAAISAVNSSGNVNNDTNLIFETSNVGTGSEKMRITSGGYTKMSNDGSYFGSTGAYHELRNSINAASVWITNTKNSGSEEIVRIKFTNYAPNNTSNWFIYADDSTMARFYVRSDGGIGNYSGNNLNLASDRRLKKDISPLSTEWDKLKQIEVVNFKYKDSTNETALYGAIAQQVQEVYPNLVVVTREATETEPEYYGLREQPFQWLTTKVLQEAMAKIEELTQKLNALENK
jgi:hypothetical protein